MNDKFTPEPETNPHSAQLTAAGVPEELHEWLRGHGVGALVEKMGIVFLEMSPERIVATMPVEGNTQVAGILHGGAHVVLAETLGSFAAAFMPAATAARWASTSAPPTTGPSPPAWSPAPAPPFIWAGPWLPMKSS